MTTSEWIRTGYFILTEILCAAGIWGIMAKCGEKGWYGLIPGFRWYKLGIIGGRETDGITAMAFDVFSLFFRVVAEAMPQTNSIYALILPVTITIGIINMIYQIRVMIGVLRTFRMRRGWIFLFIFAKWFILMRIGFSRKCQPVDLGRYDEDELLPGTAPAAIAGAVDETVSDTGLVIHLRDRTVRAHMRKRYLLKDISLTIPNGSLVLLLGGSGAGKTTLINAIIGYEKANADVYLNGRNIYSDYDEMKYRIGYVPQQDLLRLNDSVMRTLSDAAAFRLPRTLSQEERSRRIESVIETLGLAGRANGLVAKKSGGQRKRISIGLELISDPDLFILDEPDSGLDGVIARELFEKLRAVADSGRIVIAITHTPDRVIDLFDKVIVLARDSGKVGRLAFYGTPDEARSFFERDTMERIVMTVNPVAEGGEGRADEIIAKFAGWTQERGSAADE